MIPNFREKLADWGQKIEKGVQTLKETAVSAKEHLKAKLDEQGNKTTKSVEKTNSNSNDIGLTCQRVWNNRPSLREISNTLGLTAMASTVGRAFESTSKEKTSNETHANFNNHTVKYSNPPSNPNLFTLKGNPPNTPQGKGTSSEEGMSESEHSTQDPPTHTTNETNATVPQMKEVKKETEIPKDKDEPASQEFNKTNSNTATLEHPEVNGTHTNLPPPDLNTHQTPPQTPHLAGIQTQNIPAPQPPTLTEQKQKLEKLLNFESRALSMLENPKLSSESREKINLALDQGNREIQAISWDITAGITHPEKCEQYSNVFGHDLVKIAILETCKYTDAEKTLTILVAAHAVGCDITAQDLKSVRPHDFEELRLDIVRDCFTDPSGAELCICINAGLVSANTKLFGGLTLLELVSDKRTFQTPEEKVIKQALKTQDAEAYLEAKVSLYMRAAGHTLSLSGNSMEGYQVEFFLYKMNKLNPKLSDSGQINEGRMKTLEHILETRSTGKNQSVEEIMEKIYFKEPVLLSGGFNEHSMSVVIWGNKLVICNRGGGSNGKPLEIYSVNPSRLTEQVIGGILSSANQDYEHFMDFFRHIKSEIGFSTTLPDLKLEAFAKNEMPMQTTGNCTYANARAGMFAVSLIDAYRKNPNLYQDPSSLKILAQENQYLEKFYTDHFVEKFNNKVSHLKTDHEMGEDIKRIQDASLERFQPVDLKVEAKNINERLHNLKDVRPDLHAEVMQKFQKATGYNNPAYILIKLKSGQDLSPIDAKAYQVIRDLVLNAHAQLQ